MSTITAEAGLTVSRTVSRTHRAVRIRRYLETAGPPVLLNVPLRLSLLTISNLVIISP